MGGRHWPIGLLYDFYTALDPTKDEPLTRQNFSSTSQQPELDEEPDPGFPKLPWTITLRFQNYPHDHVMSLESSHALHDTFMNAIKEADFARNGNAKAVMSLSRLDSTQLWQSIETHSYESYWQVMEKLISANHATPRNVPMRIYNPETGQVILAAVPVRQVNTPRTSRHPFTRCFRTAK